MTPASLSAAGHWTFRRGRNQLGRGKKDRVGKTGFVTTLSATVYTVS